MMGYEATWSQQVFGARDPGDTGMHDACRMRWLRGERDA